VAEGLFDALGKGCVSLVGALLGATYPEWLTEQRPAHERLTTEIVGPETGLNDPIQRLFDLTPDEIRIVEQPNSGSGWAHYRSDPTLPVSTSTLCRALPSDQSSPRRCSWRSRCW
jgi:hypothetical protein